MKTEVKKIDDIKRELSIEVAGDIVKNKFEDVFGKVSKEAKVAGFRQGHIPRDIIEKNFSATINEQVLKELIPGVYSDAIKQESLDVVDMPEIFDIKLDRERLSFKASVEVSPQIDLKNYKGIKINFQKTEVTSDDVKRYVDSLKESRKVDNADDSFAKSLGYPGMTELEKFVEMQLFIQKQNQQRKKIEEEVIESITKNQNFKLPQSFLNRQQQELLRQVKMDMAMKGVPREKIDAQEESLIKELRPEAEKQVRIYLILSEIAKRENITIDDHMPHKVMELLLKEADWQGQN